ncbi:hypothetical protein AVEN_221323-1, partial [Araneus ventricosus]
MNQPPTTAFPGTSIFCHFESTCYMQVPVQNFHCPRERHVLHLQISA